MKYDKAILCCENERTKERTKERTSERVKVRTKERRNEGMNESMNNENFISLKTVKISDTLGARISISWFTY